MSRFSKITCLATMLCFVCCSVTPVSGRSRESDHASAQMAGSGGDTDAKALGANDPGFQEKPGAKKAAKEFPWLLAGLGAAAAVVAVVLLTGKKKPSPDGNDPDGNIPDGNDIEWGSVSDIEGNVYRTVRIGSQEWMAENLKTTRYNDGQPIPNITGDSEWYNLSTPAYCWYNNDIANKETYGALYNWFAVNTGRLAPAGWHVPSREEWNTLINYLGGQDIAGGKLKETGDAHWLSPNAGATNETGFSARGVGIRDITFMMMRETTYIWSSSSDPAANSGAFQVHLYYGYPWANLYSMQKYSGFSVRCVRD
jgi:uncharacterized protein (TIGR02145 family)